MAKLLRAGSQLLGGGGAFSPKSIASLQLWLDCNDLTTLFQDTAGATPVTADGQSVARINDKAASAALIQSTAGARPIYKASIQNGRGVLRTDGNDSLSVSNISLLRNVAGATVFAAVSGTKPGTAANVMQVANGAATQRLALWREETAGSLGVRGRRLDADASQEVHGGTFTAGEWMIHAAWVDYTATSIRLYKNGGTAIASSAAFQTAGNTSDTISLTTSILGGNLNGDLGGILLFGVALTVAQMNQVGAWMAARWGLTWSAVS